jgi:hypothetical protein
VLIIIINNISYNNYSNDCSNNHSNISDNLYCNITLNTWNYFLPSFILQKKAIWENLPSKKGNNCNNNNLHADDFKFCHDYAKDLQFCQNLATYFKLR